MPDFKTAGERRWFVAIEQLTEIEDPEGAPIEGWSLLASEWMFKEQLNALERFMDDQLAARLYTRWVLPYRSTMDPDRLDVPKTRRLVYEGRQYDIQRAALFGLTERQVELVTIASTSAEAARQGGLL